MDVKAVDLINKAHNLINRNDRKLLEEILVHAENKNMDLSIIKEKCKNAFFRKISSFLHYFLVPGGLSYFEYAESRKEYLKQKKELKWEMLNFMENNSEKVEENEFLNIFAQKM